MSFAFDVSDVPPQVISSLKEIEEDIRIDRRSGKGANGYLFFGLNRILDREVAIKYYCWVNDPANHAEPSLLASVKHDGVLEVLDARVVCEDWAMFQTPFCGNGDLDHLISTSKPTLHQALDLAFQIAGGVAALHAVRLLHRDLKPANILVRDDGRAAIGDFGSVAHVPEGATEIPGSRHSPLYRPPESWQTGTYRAEGDLYQIGLVLYQLLGGYLPYSAEDWLSDKERECYRAGDPFSRSRIADDALCRRAVAGRLISPSTLPPWVTKPARRLLNKACNPNPLKRYATAPSLANAIYRLRQRSHDWRTDCGVPTVDIGARRFRILADSSTQNHFVEKKANKDWRRDNSPGVGSEDALVRAINDANPL